MQNVVPPAARSDPPIERAVAERTLRDRSDAYADEVRRLIDAAYAVMRRTGGIDPRVSDIVTEAGLSNQAFYRHFHGKDELLLAVLDDGQRRLVSYLEARLARVQPGAPRVRAWIEGVLEQARNREAAANTRPFALNVARLADRFPVESARSRELVVAPLRAAVREAGGDTARDADAIYHLAMGRTSDAIARGEAPTRPEVDHLVDFALKGIGPDVDAEGPARRATAGGRHAERAQRMRRSRSSEAEAEQ